MPNLLMVKKIDISLEISKQMIRTLAVSAVKESDDMKTYRFQQILFFRAGI